MTTVLPTSVLPADWTAADMLSHLGGIPLDRIRMVPPPGTATEQDVLESESRTNRVCELIDGTLVEKTMGSFESLLAAEIIYLIKAFVRVHNLGVVLAPDGALRILPRQVRVPDVSFIRWERFPARRLPRDPIYAVAPDLAVEVLSEGNTKAEMSRKLRDYFTAGVQLVWYIDPKTRSARAYTAEDRWTDASEMQSLSGGDVLPGFELSLQELFAKADEEHPA